MRSQIRPLIAGNWKMNGLHRDGVGRARDLLARLRSGEARCDVAVCPPASLLHPIAEVLRGSPIALGGQDCHAEDSGAHTGDLSAAMLADAGCRFVIVGHSERRVDHGENDALVQAKAAAAHRAGLSAIVCLGESESDRDSGQTAEVVGAQLSGSLPPGATPANTVVAYEPVWAIGSGRTPGIDEIGAVHAHLRQLLISRLGDEAARLRLLYGGSVKPGNAAEILEIDEVNGALVGGASLVVDDLWAICQNCP
jgi:triosephosphate isomerase